MKNKIILITFFLSFIISFNLFSQWVQISNGLPSNSAIGSFTSNNGYIFASAGYGGVYSTSNFGLNWAHTSLNSNYSVIVLLSVGNIIYAGTQNGLHRSTDQGVTWNQFGLNNKRVVSLVISGNNFLAGTQFDYSNYGDLYLSTDNGLNWLQTSYTNQSSIISFLKINNLTFAGTSFGGVLVSSNNGINWYQSGLLNKEVLSLTSSGNNIYASTFLEGVYISTNFGIEWNAIGLNNYIVHSIVSNGNYLFAGIGANTPYYSGTVYLSSNNGANWIDRGQGFIWGIYISSLFLTDNYIFAGSAGNSIWRRNKSEIVDIHSIQNEIPSSFFLFQNYPNPFNNLSIIKYQINRNSAVSLKIFNSVGSEVIRYIYKNQEKGIYEIIFDGDNFASGIYFYKLEAGEFSETKKMILLK
jgi:hypothetical protein